MDPLKPKQLRPACNPKQFDFESTTELSEFDEIVGQQRALDALKFGLSIKKEGYNLFAIGSPGIAKRSVITKVLSEHAAKKAVPFDWCYVNNFKNPRHPLALKLPPGKGNQLKRDMAALIEELKIAIPAILESDDYQQRLRELDKQFKSQTQKKYKSLAEEAKQAAQVRKKRREFEKEIQKEFTIVAVGHLIAELKENYEQLPDVMEYLFDVEKDIVDNVGDFLDKEEKSLNFGYVVTEQPSLRRYQVNVLIDQSEAQAAPVIYEDNSTLENLIGHIEHVMHLGALLTDFSLIRSGVLHRANGGYLILDIQKLLANPLAWEALKRALRSHSIQIESTERPSDTVTLRPQPIPIDIKIILISDRYNYYYLCELDTEFDDLFKVVIDFEEQLSYEPENNKNYAYLIGELVRKENLIPFDNKAVAAVIDYSRRLSGDSKKLSMHMRLMTDLLRQADYWARKRKNKIVGPSDVKFAIKRQIKRVDHMRARLVEEIDRDMVLIATEGEVVGQVNGLSLVEFGHFRFGHPSRITAVARLGDGEVLDIQREAELSGSVHSKAFMILSGFISGRYALNHPLSLSASIVFEQTYGMVDGDSASMAELCALLSALADVPIKQSFAITGSVNQFGKTQSIGGINEKIEGFYEICKLRGLTGEQGVIIPESNVQNLMLHDEVVSAARRNKFNIYAVETIDEAISLLTGMRAGERNKRGNFPKGSVNYLVEKNLVRFSKIIREEHKFE